MGLVLAGALVSGGFVVEEPQTGRVLDGGRLTHDSRLVEPGDVFAALAGTTPAAAAHVRVALERGRVQNSAGSS